MNYDLIVLGGGPAGYLAAERAAAAKLNVLLIEKRSVGGVCLNEGCIPSKSLLYSAKILDNAKHGEKYGVIVKGIELDHKKVIERKNKVVSTLVSGIKSALKAHKVTIIEGVGVISKKTAEGYSVEVNGEAYSASRLLIATGSMPVVPPIKGVAEGIKSGFVLTNREILDLESVPKELVIIGGGVIGLEMASYYNSAGSNVTVIEMLENIGGANDIDLMKILLKNYKEKGITFELGAKVTELTDDTVIFERDGNTQTVKANKVLLSIGRKPVISDIGLENIGVEIQNNAVKTDRYMKTNIPNVYAAGDITGSYMLAHVAYREAEVAVNNMLSKRDTMRYDAIPSVIYTTPEVAAVGETEQTAKQKGLDVEVTSLTMKYSGRYVAENENGDGICKMVFDKKTKRILGCHIIGSYASEIIMSAVIMIESCMSVERAKEFIFPHPCVCEIIRESIFSIK